MTQTCNCPHAKACPLYDTFTWSSTADIWKALFCHSPKHTNCARFTLAAQGRPVPLNLLPNGKTLTA